MSHRVTILHTNDFHNHLKQPQADLLARLKRDSGPDTLLLDAGDAVFAGNVGVRPGGEPILAMMNGAGYDAMTMGNREFHVADIALRHKIANATFPILCANIRYKSPPEERKELPVQPHTVKTLPSGVRVGAIGVTVPMVTERMAARHVSAFLFDDPIETVKREVGKLRGEVDILIALTHIGIKADEQLAMACRELDLIITGHTHLIVRHADKSDRVPIMQAGWFAHYYGRVEFDVNLGFRPHIVASDILPLGDDT